jgi:hypothetical protein
MTTDGDRFMAARFDMSCDVFWKKSHPLHEEGQSLIFHACVSDWERQQ